MAVDYTSKIVSNNTRYVKQEDPDGGGLVDQSAIQTVLLNGLDTNDITALQAAADKCDTVAELGSPSLPAAFEIKLVDVRPLLLDSTQAVVTVVWGRNDWNFGPARRKSAQKEWAVPFRKPIKRYVKSNGSAVAGSGDTVMLGPNRQPQVVYPEVPSAYIYRLEIETSSPASLEDEWGKFLNEGGYLGPSLTGFTSSEVKYLGKDTKHFEVGSSDLWYDIDIFEFRASNPTDGWDHHLIDQDNTVVVMSENSGTHFP